MILIVVKVPCTVFVHVHKSPCTVTDEEMCNFRYMMIVYLSMWPFIHILSGKYLQGSVECTTVCSSV